MMTKRNVTFVHLFFLFLDTTTIYDGSETFMTYTSLADSKDNGKVKTF